MPGAWFYGIVATPVAIHSQKDSGVTTTNHKGTDMHQSNQKQADIPDVLAMEIASSGDKKFIVIEHSFHTTPLGEKLTNQSARIVRHAYTIEQAEDLINHLKVGIDRISSGK
ncbi:TPA: hypothetical protein ACXNDR_003052 [Serratia marcescens]